MGRANFQSDIKFFMKKRGYLTTSQHISPCEPGTSWSSYGVDKHALLMCKMRSTDSFYPSYRHIPAVSRFPLTHTCVRTCHRESLPVPCLLSVWATRSFLCRNSLVQPSTLHICPFSYKSKKLQNILLVNWLWKTYSWYMPKSTRTISITGITSSTITEGLPQSSTVHTIYLIFNTKLCIERSMTMLMK